MKIASIDIGSNTVLLLIAEFNNQTKNLNPVINRIQVPRISTGLYKENHIIGYRIKQLLKVLRDYKEIAENHNCDSILVNATNALRVAENSKEILKQVKEELGLDISVISGEREAYLSYLGARSSFPGFDKTFVLDIGGGSTEMIYGDSESINFRKSFKAGAVSLTEEFVLSYPVPLEEYGNLQLGISQRFAELSEIRNRRIPLISVAGTPTSLSCINQGIKEYDDSVVEGSQISRTELTGIIEEMKKLTPGEILNQYGQVVSGREDVILTGAMILLEVMNLIEVNETLVSSRGLRYGAIYDFIKYLQ